MEAKIARKYKKRNDAMWKLALSQLRNEEKRCKKQNEERKAVVKSTPLHIREPTPVPTVDCWTCLGLWVFKDLVRTDRTSPLPK